MCGMRVCYCVVHNIYVCGVCVRGPYVCSMRMCYCMCGTYVCVWYVCVIFANVSVICTDDWVEYSMKVVYTSCF